MYSPSRQEESVALACQFPRPVPKAYMFTKKMQKLQSIDRQIRKKWAQLNSQNKNKQIEQYRNAQQEQRIVGQRQRISKQAGMLVSNPLNDMVIGHRLNRVQLQRENQRQANAFLRKRYYEDKYYGKRQNLTLQSCVQKRIRAQIQAQFATHQVKRQNDDGVTNLSFNLKTEPSLPVMNDLKNNKIFTNKKLSPIAKRHKTEQNYESLKRKYKRQQSCQPKEQNPLDAYFHRDKSEGEQSSPSRQRVPLMLRQRSIKQKRVYRIISQQYQSEIKKLVCQTKVEAEKYFDNKNLMLNKLKGDKSKVYYHMISSWEPKDGLSYMESSPN